MSTEFWYPLLMLCIVVGSLVAIAEIAEHMVAKASHRRLVWLACLVGVTTAVPVFVFGVPVYVQEMVFGRSKPENIGAVEISGSRFGQTQDTLHVDHVSSPVNPGEGRDNVSSPASLFPAKKAVSDGVQDNGDDTLSSQSATDWRILTFVAVWFTGIIGGLGWFLLQRWSIGKLLQTAELVRNGSLEDWLVSQSKSLGFKKRLRLIRCMRLQTPVAFGIIRPTIGVPKDFPIEPLGIRSQAVLLHELSHLAAGDPFWNSLATLMKIVLWWHPIIWFASLRLKQSCEEAADEATILLPNGPKELAAGLVECARYGMRARIPGLAAVRPSQSQSSLARRVRRLLLLEKKGRNVARLSRIKAIQKAVVATTASAVFVASLGFPFPEFVLAEGDLAMRRQHSLWRHSLIAAAITAFVTPWGIQALAEEGPKPDQPRDVVREERRDAPREGERAVREGEARERGEARRREGEQPRAAEREGRREEGRVPGRLAELERRMEELRQALREAETADQADRAERLRQEIRGVETQLQQMRERGPDAGIPPEAREQMMERIERAMKETQERLREAREAGREEIVRELERRVDQLEQAMRDVREGRRPGLPFRLEAPPMVMREQAMERLQRAMNEVRERLQRAREAGREEEVRELEQQLGRMERQMAELREARPPLPPLGPVAPERMERARRAAELLRREGFGDMAEFLMRSLEREMRPVPPPEPGRVGPPGLPPRRPDRPEERPVERPDRPAER